MINASEIREHMEVVGSDGHHVGRVDHVKGSEIELTKFDFGAGLRHHFIPLSWVDHVDQQGVHLNMSTADAKSEWGAKH